MYEIYFGSMTLSQTELVFVLTIQDTVYISVCICKVTSLLCWMCECCPAVQLVSHGYLGRYNAVLPTQLFLKSKETHTFILKSSI